jgi:hypothetical protein
MSIRRRSIVRKRAHGPTLLTVNQALYRMRRGATLINVHGKRPNWLVVPGGAVSDTVAGELRTHPHVVGQADGLLPEHHQSWRLHDVNRLPNLTHDRRPILTLLSDELGW